MKIVQGTKTTLKEFRSFALKANAIDLAIGVAIGGAFTAVVQAVVGGLFTPLIAAIFGQPSFAKLYFTINGSRILYGLFVNAIFTLLTVAAFLFFFVVKPIAAVKHRIGRDEPVSPLAPCPACLTAINTSARRCPACTEILTDGWSTF